MEYLYIKALHIIFIISWYAGLLYVVRLFIYQTEALEKNEPEKTILSDQLRIMTRRLWYIITWPSAILTLIFGALLLILEPSFLHMSFMHIKLTFVFLLYVYHFSCHYLYKSLSQGIRRFTSNQLRMWNEVATVILVAIVFLIVVRSELSWLWGTLGLFLLVGVLMLAVRIYKRMRERS